MIYQYVHGLYSYLLMCNIMNSSCLYVSADSGQKFEIVCTFSEMSHYFFNISMTFEER